MIVLDTSALFAYLVGTDAVAELVRAEAQRVPLAELHAVDLRCASGCAASSKAASCGR